MIPFPSRIVRCGLAAALALAASARAADPAPAAPAQGDFRSARWGMTADEVLAAFPGQAFRLEPPLALKDGNVVAVGLPQETVADLAFRVRFVFEKGKLALVSYRTPENQPVKTAAPFTALEKLLTERWGKPTERSSDDNFVDMRLTRWRAGPRTIVDLKYIPGVVVILYHPAEEAAPAAAPAAR